MTQDILDAVASVIIWVSPLSFLGSDFKFSYKFLMKILSAKRIASDQMRLYYLPSVASHLGLYCLTMSHDTKEATNIFLRSKKHLW